MDKSISNGAGVNAGNGASAAGKTQRDSGFSLRPQDHWWYLV